MWMWICVCSGDAHRKYYGRVWSAHRYARRTATYKCGTTRMQAAVEDARRRNATDTHIYTIARVQWQRDLALHTKYLVFLIKMETFVLLLFINAPLSAACEFWFCKTHSKWSIRLDDAAPPLLSFVALRCALLFGLSAAGHWFLIDFRYILIYFVHVFVIWCGSSAKSFVCGKRMRTVTCDTVRQCNKVGARSGSLIWTHCVSHFILFYLFVQS